jgi:hypothetical protein
MDEYPRPHFDDPWQPPYQRQSYYPPPPMPAPRPPVRKNMVMKTLAIVFLSLAMFVCVTDAYATKLAVATGGSFIAFIFCGVGLIFLCLI